VQNPGGHQDLGGGVEFGSRAREGPRQRSAADEAGAARLFVKRPLSGEVRKWSTPQRTGLTMGQNGNVCENAAKAPVSMAATAAHGPLDDD